MFLIIGINQEKRETIDYFKTREQAEKALAEYRVAFGSAWTMWVEWLHDIGDAQNR